MRIVLTSNFSPWSAYSGGGQRSTHQLASALSELGHDVHVVYTATPGRKPQPDTDPSYAIHWALFFDWKTRRSAPLRPLNAFSVRHVVSRLHEEKPLSVVHCQGEEGMMLGAWAEEQSVPLIITPRYPVYPEVLTPNMSAVQRAWMWLRHGKYMTLEQALLKARCICPTSEAAKGSIQRAYGLLEQEFEVIPNGIDSAFFQGQWRGEDRDELLFFGRLAHDKGIDVLLEAIGDLNVRLHVVGRGDEEEALKVQANRLGLEDRVRWTSWLDTADLIVEIEKAALVVLPSRHESFGNAMAETLAVGAPLVTTRAGSIPAVVGDCALLAEPGCVATLKSHLEKALEDSEEINEAARKGRIRMSERFRWTAVAEAFVAVYERKAYELKGRID